ncbi:hypothetical protein LTR62_006491 [Meristemomyces frigidus]|uniref:Uncharacterized protein n=1 Tax=Meristemomyces frigidus TaxID=1508187 RepID=A0AAN7YEH2_9PEZI|nr:hypothetical protein LTR62_006491 [Meristemomyces frigidus]
MASLNMTEKKRRRFQSALKKLSLKVYIHGSQVYEAKVSADFDDDVSKDGAIAAKKKATAAAETNWLRLLLMTESQ